MMSVPQSKACRASFGRLRTAYRDRVKQIAQESLGPNAPEDHVLEIGMVLVCALFTGPHSRFIARLTGLPEVRCAKWEARARRLGIFSRSGVDADPWLEDAPPGVGGVNFALDVLVVAGDIRCKGPRGPDRVYYCA